MRNSAVHHVFVLGHHRGESSDRLLIAGSSARFVAQALRLFRGGAEVVKLVETATIGAQPVYPFPETKI